MCCIWIVTASRPAKRDSLRWDRASHRIIHITHTHTHALISFSEWIYNQLAFKYEMHSLADSVYVIIKHTERQKRQLNREKIDTSYWRRLWKMYAYVHWWKVVSFVCKLSKEIIITKQREGKKRESFKRQTSANGIHTADTEQRGARTHIVAQAAYTSSFMSKSVKFIKCWQLHNNFVWINVYAGGYVSRFRLRNDSIGRHS